MGGMVEVVRNTLYVPDVLVIVIVFDAIDAAYSFGRGDLVFICDDIFFSVDDDCVATFV